MNTLGHIVKHCSLTWHQKSNKASMSTKQWNKASFRQYGIVLDKGSGIGVGM